jgi:hypothetical protein
MKNIDTKKYVIAFLITAVIFFSALYLANWLGQKKIDELRSIQDQISTNILSSEVQTALLQEFSCKEVGPTAVSAELGALGDKLSYAEQTRNANDSQVIALKQYYSLLEIKDFLLMRQVSQKCGTRYAFVLYFYGKDCADCDKQGFVLTKLREDYPQLRVYSFDYNLDLSAIQTLISINKVDNNLPALLIDDETFYGFQSIDNMTKAIPQIAIWQKENALNNATSTNATSTKK